MGGGGVDVSITCTLLISRGFPASLLVAAAAGSKNKTPPHPRNQQGAKSALLDTRGKSEEAGNGVKEQLRGVRGNGGIRSNRGRQDMGFFFPGEEEEETRNEDLAGKGRGGGIRSPQRSVLR